MGNKHPKYKLKKFIKSETASETAVELLKMFILPFAKCWDPKAAVDDAIAAFFALDDRKIVRATARVKFKMPGIVRKPWTISGKVTPRDIEKGSPLLIVLDRKDQTAKVDAVVEGREITYHLLRPQFEFLKDKVVIHE